MTRRTHYEVAGRSLLVEAQDPWSAEVIDTLFAGWYLAPDAGASEGGSAPAIVIRSAVDPIPIPHGLSAFPIAGGGVCHTDGATSYINVENSVVAISREGLEVVEIWTNDFLPIDSPELTRLVTYALSAALRQRRLFELHSAALVHTDTGQGVLIVGPSGSGKSTLTVHLASAGWLFLTDDVLLLSRESGAVQAWPLRRSFAITSDTFAGSRFLQTRTSFESMAADDHGKQHFLPHSVFTSAFADRCTPMTVFFSELAGETASRVSRLSPGETMARLIRMSPWCCYDRSTASEHIAVLSALATQSRGYSLLAGPDLLEPETAVQLIGRHVSR